MSDTRLEDCRTVCYGWGMSEAPTKPDHATEVREIPLERIHAGVNDRKQFDDADIAELAASIAQNGLAQPITLRSSGLGYEIIAGERRFRAHQLLGLPTVRALVTEMTDEQASTIMLIENINRVDINPIEEAHAYQSRVDRFGWTIEQIAERTGKTIGVVNSRLALLKLDEDVQHALANGGFWIAGAADIAGLDKNRQRLCVNAYAHNPRMTGAEWKALTRRLYKEQADENQESLLDPDDFMVVAEYVEISKAEQRPTTKHLIEFMAMMVPHLRFVQANASGATNAAQLEAECHRICSLFDIDPNSDHIRRKANDLLNQPT